MNSTLTIERLADHLFSNSGVYRYGLSQRPYSLGTAPDGVVEHITPELGLNAERWHRHGELTYVRALSASEQSQYSLPLFIASENNEELARFIQENTVIKHLDEYMEELDRDPESSFAHRGVLKMLERAHDGDANALALENEAAFVQAFSQVYKARQAQKAAEFESEKESETLFHGLPALLNEKGVETLAFFLGDEGTQCGLPKDASGVIDESVVSEIMQSDSFNQSVGLIHAELLEAGLMRIAPENTLLAFDAKDKMLYTFASDLIHERKDITDPDARELFYAAKEISAVNHLISQSNAPKLEEIEVTIHASFGQIESVSLSAYNYDRKLFYDEIGNTAVDRLEKTALSLLNVYHPRWDEGEGGKFLVDLLPEYGKLTMFMDINTVEQRAITTHAPLQKNSKASDMLQAKEYHYPDACIITASYQSADISDIAFLDEKGSPLTASDARGELACKMQVKGMIKQWLDKRYSNWDNSACTGTFAINLGENEVVNTHSEQVVSSERQMREGFLATSFIIDAGADVHVGAGDGMAPSLSPEKTQASKERALDYFERLNGSNAHSQSHSPKM